MLGVQALGPLLSAQPAAREGDGDADGSGCGVLRGGRRSHGDSRSQASQRDAWLRLASVPGLGPVTIGLLLETFGSARLAVEAATSQPREFDDALRERASDEGSGGARLGDLARRIAAASRDGEELARRVDTLELAVVTLDDDGFPARLRSVDFPPPLLFVRGSLAALDMPHAVAVVGTRRATDSGRRIAGWIASAAGRMGACVISGLAVGIDGAAHAAAVAEGAATVAVLGGGHARLFPKSHARLADAIVTSGGAIVAELPPDTEPARGTFPRRNRIISGLADATVVVEAGLQSGALITAGWALEQGRDCFLVPGALESPASQGCNAFLRGFPGQARAVCGVPELLEDLGLVPGSTEFRSEASAARRPNGRTAPADLDAILATLGDVEARIARSIAAGTVTADQLAAQTGLPVSTILSTLTLLELRGLASSTYGRYAAAGALVRWRTPGRADRGRT